MTDTNVPNGWTDRTDYFFAPGEGFAIQRATKSAKFGKGIVANIRSRYQGQNADLDDKFEDFKEGCFYLQLQSPRGYSTEALKLREIVNQSGNAHFSADLEMLVKLAEKVTS